MRFMLEKALVNFYKLRMAMTGGYMKKFTILTIIAFLLAACANPGQNRYMEAEVGKTRTVSFGTIIAVREIEIQGAQTGLGIAGGATAGAGTAAAVSDSAAIAIGAGLAGAALGALAEEQLQKRKGVEYTVILESGLAMTVAQNLNKDDRILSEGERVIVQNTGQYQRVLPASHLPTEVKRPQGITVVD